MNGNTALDARQYIAGRAPPSQPPTPIAGPSLEDRLEHLQRGLERLSKVRNGLEVMADRLNSSPSDPRAGGIAPQPSALADRFGDTIAGIQGECDRLEYIAEQLYRALFSTANKCEAGRG